MKFTKFKIVQIFFEFGHKNHKIDSIWLFRTTPREDKKLPYFNDVQLPAIKLIVILQIDTVSL